MTNAMVFLCTRFQMPREQAELSSLDAAPYTDIVDQKIGGEPCTEGRRARPVAADC